MVGIGEFGSYFGAGWCDVGGGNGSGSATAEIKDIQFKINTSIQDRIDPLMERMKLWLCQNRHEFAKFKNNCGGMCEENGSDIDGISHIRKTNFITNIYEDEPLRGAEWLR